MKVVIHFTKEARQNENLLEGCTKKAKADNH